MGASGTTVATVKIFQLKVNVHMTGNVRPIYADVNQTRVTTPGLVETLTTTTVAASTTNASVIGATLDTANNEIMNIGLYSTYDDVM